VGGGGGGEGGRGVWTVGREKEKLYQYIIFLIGTKDRVLYVVLPFTMIITSIVDNDPSFSFEFFQSIFFLQQMGLMLNKSIR